MSTNTESYFNFFIGFSIFSELVMTKKKKSRQSSEKSAPEAVKIYF